MCDSESEDSENEGGFRNIYRVIIRPPGQSGKAKRGHLCFDAAFETGNLGRANLIGDFEYDLFLRPDTCNPRFRFWFNFTVDNVKQNQRVIFHIVNLSKTKNLFNGNLTPLVKSSSRPKWLRLPKHTVFYYRSTIHQQRYVLSFAFNFDKEDDVYQFAVAPPYSYSRLQSYLNVIQARHTESWFTRSVLCTSLQNRKLDLLTIDHLTDKIGTELLNSTFIRVIVIICRSHPGETPSSFVCQGFLEFLIGSHPIGKILRKNLVFKILPMINPDGVFLGNNRCNVIGQDMNRMWHLATEFSHPTLYAIKNMLKMLDDSNVSNQQLPIAYYQIDFVIDLHAHNSQNGCFIYGNTYEDVYRHERHLVFPRLFASNAQDYVEQNMMFNADERKVGCSRRFFSQLLSDTVNTYSLEISIGGYYLEDLKTVASYNENGYFRCGINLARTFLTYYRFINVLPLPMVTDLHPKRLSRMRSSKSVGHLKTRHEVKSCDRTKRYCAPISLKNLSIYDSKAPSNKDLAASSHSGRIQKFTRNNQILSPQYGEFFNVPNTPQLSIIDLNQLIRSFNIS